MRPEKDPVDAGKWLLDCLSSKRNDKLCLEQVLWILREARKINCHAGATFILRDAGYADPQPIEPEDERAALQRSFVESVKLQRQLLTRLESLGAA